MKTLVTVLLTSLLTASLVATGPAAAREVGARLGITAATSTTTIPLQVRLASSSGTPVNGLKTVTFKLYTVPSGGSALWTEAWTAGNAVQVTDGVASVLLGSQTVLPQSLIATNSTLYLGITVDVEAEMLPRVQLGSAPIAMTVPDGSIGTVKIADGAITQAKAPALVGSATNNTRVAYGTAVATRIAGSDFGQVDVSLVGQGFTLPPSALCGLAGGSGFLWSCHTQYETKDYFRIYVIQPGNTTWTTIDVRWVAIGN